MVNTNILKQLTRQFIYPEIPFFEPRFNAQLLVFASYKFYQGATIIDTLRACRLVVCGLLSEPKGFQFESD